MALDDTQNSANDAPAVDAAVAAPDAAPAVDPVADTDDGDVTALGGKLPDPDAAAADPAADDAPAAPVIPEAYELTAPEGMTLDADLLAEATPIFKEMGLTNEAANKVLPIAKTLMDKTRDATVQQIIDQGAQRSKSWLEEARSTPELSGGHWEESSNPDEPPRFVGFNDAIWNKSLATAAKGLDAFGFPEDSPFRKYLTETGLGNHPEMIRSWAKIGAMVGEDGAFVRSDAGAKVEQTREERWYGKKE